MAELLSWPCLSHGCVSLMAVPLIGVHVIYYTGVELNRMEFRAKRYREVGWINKYSEVTNQR
jgi:hypothetical protein